MFRSISALVLLCGLAGACTIRSEKEVVTPAGPSASDSCVAQGYASGTPAYDRCVARGAR